MSSLRAPPCAGSIGLSGQYASVDEHLTGRSNLVMIGELSRLRRREAKRRAAELLASSTLSRPPGGRCAPTRAACGAAWIWPPACSAIPASSSSTSRRPASIRIAGLPCGGSSANWSAPGTTVLLTTQYLEEADQLADRICVVDGGRVIAEGTPAELKAAVGTAHLRLVIPPAASLTRRADVLASHAAGPIRRLAGLAP